MIASTSATLTSFPSLPLGLYIVMAVVYIMTIHFAVSARNIFMMAGFFIFGGVIGYIYKSYEIGFALSVILSLVLW